MEIIKKINKEIAFNHNISEITSICMDIDYEQEDSSVVGNLNLEGEYISSDEISMCEDFEYKIDFEYPIEEEIKSDTLNLTIDDFTYDIDQDKLIINVDLKLNYEEAESEDRKEFDKFLDSQEIDIEDYLETIKQKDENKFEKFEENNNLNYEPINDTINIEKNEDAINLENSIINITNNIDDTDEYITYHIYVVNEADTLETIANRYNINVEAIKEYNEVENIKSGMKIVIPCDNE